MAQWHQMTPEETVRELGTDPTRGLSQEEASSRLLQFGPNELQAKAQVGFLQMLFAQFRDILVLILLVAAAVSFLVGEPIDAGVILVIVILNAFLGASQERRAGKALEALQRMAAPRAQVVREGRTAEIPTRELVPGDLVLLETGDYVPADLRLVEIVNLKVEEASLTGESVSVEKQAADFLPEEAPLGDRVNSAFSGTIVTYGRGRGIVTETGMRTEMGRIAEMIESYEQQETPLQKKLTGFGKVLGIVALMVVAAVFILGLLRDEPLLLMFMTSVSLAVAAIPEGLPAIVTIVLALGMKRMVRRHAIVKRLHAVESLGSVTVICSDKTGTLTRNEMTVTDILAGEKLYEVSGNGYEPEGTFTRDGREVNPLNDPDMRMLLAVCALNNDSKLEHTEAGNDTWQILGDPTEGALLVAARKAGIGGDGGADTEAGTAPSAAVPGTLPRLQEIPFDSVRKRMTTFHPDPEQDGAHLALVKGAPDLILDLCTRIRKDGKDLPLTGADREAVLEANRGMAKQALRVLAFAYRPMDGIPDNPMPEEVERELVFIGLAGMIDPPRQEAIESIRVCREAGIRPMMITGDYRDTAAAVARELGIISDESEARSGADLDDMDDRSLQEEVKRVSVFARVSPKHKVRIVDALKANGEIVSMTGDGVNDAPALKRADVGVAMGITGTDVAKETASIILTDDNFASIVAAVEEGRTIYGNIRKFIFFLLSCNIAEILIIFIAMLVGWPIPLTPIQILWVNLVTDAFPALALGMERGEQGVMKRPPRDPEEPVINRIMRTGIILQSVAMTAAVLIAFRLALTATGSEETARVFAFTTLIVSELFRSYTARSETLSIFRIGPFSNPWIVGGTIVSFVLLLAVLYLPPLQPAFATFPLTGRMWLLVFGLGILPSLIAELSKPFLRRQEERRFQAFRRKTEQTER